MSSCPQRTLARERCLETSPNKLRTHTCHGKCGKVWATVACCRTLVTRVNVSYIALRTGNQQDSIYPPSCSFICVAPYHQRSGGSVITDASRIRASDSNMCAGLGGRAACGRRSGHEASGARFPLCPWRVWRVMMGPFVKCLEKRNGEGEGVWEVEPNETRITL